MHKVTPFILKMRAYLRRIWIAWLGVIHLAEMSILSQHSSTKKYTRKMKNSAHIKRSQIVKIQLISSKLFQSASRQRVLYLLVSLQKALNYWLVWGKRLQPWIKSRSTWTMRWWQLARRSFHANSSNYHSKINRSSKSVSEFRCNKEMFLSWSAALC